MNFLNSSFRIGHMHQASLRRDEIKRLVLKRHILGVHFQANGRQIPQLQILIGGVHCIVSDIDSRHPCSLPCKFDGESTCSRSDIQNFFSFQTIVIDEVGKQGLIHSLIIAMFADFSLDRFKKRQIQLVIGYPTNT